MMDDLRVSDRITIPGAELEERFARSGGPGGQHVNKTESKVELRWNPAASAVLTEGDRRRLIASLKLTTDGDFIVTSEKTRDQARNREDARQKLAAAVRTALVRPRRRIKTKPSRGTVERRLGGKKKRSALKKARQQPGDE